MGNIGKYAAAIQAYDNAIRIKPDYAKACHNKYIALRNQRKYIADSETINEAIQTKTDLAEACYNKGNALANQGKYDEAIKAFDEAIKIKSNFEPDAEAYCYLKGITLKRQGCDAMKCTYWQDEPRAFHGYCQLVRKWKKQELTRQEWELKEERERREEERIEWELKEEQERERQEQEPGDYDPCSIDVKKKMSRSDIIL